MDPTDHWLAIGGCAAAVLSCLAWWGDHRRGKRSHLDRVGWVPWTGVFFWSFMAAVLLLGLAGKAWLQG
jgi:hypothetical protein